MMSPEQIERAAELLVTARHQRKAVCLPHDCRPQNYEEAYAIQHRVTERLNLPVAGWKVGAAGKKVAAAENAETAVSGRLFTPHVHHSPATLDGDLFTSFRNCEVEFVFRMRRAIFPAGPSAKNEVANAVDCLYPAIEIGDSRLTDRSSAGMLVVCADNAGGARLVLGDEIPDWQRLDLPNHPVMLRFNGNQVAQGYGREVMGDPLNSLVWLVHQQLARGKPVPAGSLVATGSCTGINIAQPGDRVVADFGSLGKVQIQFGA